MTNETISNAQIDDKINYEVCRLVSWLMVLPLLTNFFGAISRMIIGSTLASTVVIYVFYLALIVKFVFYSGVEMPFMRSAINTWALTFLVLLLNYIFFAKTRVYYGANIEQLAVIFFIYLPVASSIKYVTDWSEFFEKGKLCAWMTPIVGFLGVNFLGFNDFLSYMHIGVALLPGILIAWYIFRINKQKVFLLVFIFAYLELILYGNKMSVMSVLIFIYLIEVIKMKAGDMTPSKVIILFALLLAGILLFANYETVLYSLARWLESMGFESRVLRKFATRTGFVDASRDLIYDYAAGGLHSMGFKINGLFGDRVVLRNYMSGGGYTSDYVHNIFYEMLLSFGWIIGGLILMIGLIKMIKKTFFQPFCISCFTVFMTCFIFLRLVVSSSFLVEGPFWLFVGSLLSSSHNARVVFKLGNR